MPAVIPRSPRRRWKVNRAFALASTLTDWQNSRCFQTLLPDKERLAWQRKGSEEGGWSSAQPGWQQIWPSRNGYPTHSDLNADRSQSADAKAKFSEAQAKASDMSQKAGKDINNTIDKFDKAVEEKAAKAKSGISSWFGSK
jgi:antibiotic biosynthesis monooxygenase (ABM) superfamily enzyme